MIAVANTDLLPKLSSKESRALRRDNWRANRAINRGVNRLADQEHAEHRLAAMSPSSKGAPSNKEFKRAEGARIAAERRARNKAERLARRPRPIQAENVARTVVPVALTVVPVTAPMGLEEGLEEVGF